MMPSGYTLIHMADDHIIVGAEFSRLNEVAPLAIWYLGSLYERGDLEPITLERANRYCSMRRYNICPTRITWEGDGDIIACEMDGQVFLRCPTDKTDIGHLEHISQFISRHGGVEATVEYLRFRQSKD